MEIENEVYINSQVTAPILFNHALEDFAPVYHSIIRLLYEAFSIWSLFKQQDIFWEIETYLLFIVVITLVFSKSQKTCKERNQLLVHTLKNCNKSFVDKKSIICHQTKNAHANQTTPLYWLCWQPRSFPWSHAGTKINLITFRKNLITGWYEIVYK